MQLRSNVIRQFCIGLVIVSRVSYYQRSWRRLTGRTTQLDEPLLLFRKVSEAARYWGGDSDSDGDVVMVI